MALADVKAVDIISVDSAQIYKDMNIGTAKPNQQELENYPHSLIDIRKPDEVYSASEFVEDVNKLIQQSHKNNRLPCLAGGTMMYFNALQHGLSDLPAANDKIRQSIVNEANEHGWLHCHKQLEKLDPKSAQRINANDTQRLQRALEVYKITGKTMTELCGQKQVQTNYKYIKFAYFPETRERLHSIIAERFKMMVEQGLIEETEGLLKKYNLNPDMPSLRSVGYRQVFDYLEGHLSKDEMIERGIIATRQLAKRQMTWLRREEDLTIFEPYKNIEQQIKVVLKQL